MVRVLILLFVFAGGAWAQGDEPDWDAADVYNADDPNQDDILEKDIDDFLDRSRFERESGYWYDHYGIWEELEFEVSGGLWYPELKGPITLGNLARIDITSVLGIGDPEIAGMWGIRFRHDLWEAIIDGYTVGLSGVRVIQEEIELPTEPPEIIGIDEELKTRLVVRNYRLLGGFSVYRRKAFSVTLQLGLSIYHIKFKFNALDKDRITFSQILPLPVIGIAIHGRFGPNDRWEYRAEVQGLGVKLTVDDKALGGSVVDVRATVGYRVYKALVLRVGYRYANIGAFVEGIDVDFELQGPFFEVAGSW